MHVYIVQKWEFFHQLSRDCNLINAWISPWYNMIYLVIYQTFHACISGTYIICLACRDWAASAVVHVYGGLCIESQIYIFYIWKEISSANRAQTHAWDDRRKSNPVMTLPVWQVGLFFSRKLSKRSVSLLENLFKYWWCVLIYLIYGWFLTDLFGKCLNWACQCVLYT